MSYFRWNINRRKRRRIEFEGMSCIQIEEARNDGKFVRLSNSGTEVSHIYGLLTRREVKMAGYWPSSFFASLWTETKSRSFNTQKQNEANVQPS